LRRAIYAALGAAPNPDEIDNYEITRGFPLAYVPEEDPEMIDEMKWAKEDTANAGANDDSENEVAESDRMASDESDNEGGWVDEDADGVTSELSSNKKRKKTFTAIDKVRIMLSCVLYLLIEEVDSCYRSQYSSLGSQEAQDASSDTQALRAKIQAPHPNS